METLRELFCFMCGFLLSFGLSIVGGFGGLFVLNEIGLVTKPTAEMAYCLFLFWFYLISFLVGRALAR